MLFIDFSSTFNTIIPHKLVCKLSNLGIDAALCVWIMDPLTNRPQNVKIGDCTSSTSFVNTGVPQGCVLSPVIFTFFTHDCAAIHPFNATVKFADTTIVGLFSENEETTYREEVQHFVQWCEDHNLVLNTHTHKKEIIIDFRRSKKTTHFPLHNGEGKWHQVPRSLRTEDLTWSINTSHLAKKVQQRMFFLLKIKQARLSTQLLVHFFYCIIESVLAYGIIVCKFLWGKG